MTFTQSDAELGRMLRTHLAGHFARASELNDCFVTLERVGGDGVIDRHQQLIQVWYRIERE